MALEPLMELTLVGAGGDGGAGPGKNLLPGRTYDLLLPGEEITGTVRDQQ